MITSIGLNNFKCFEKESLQLAPMTLLSGINGIGKSTLLQAMLVLRQSLVFGSLKNEGALINGPLVELGTSDDVLNENAKTDERIGFELKTDRDVAANWSFRHQAGRDILPIDVFKVDSGVWEDSLFSDAFCYLQAERIGPRSSCQMINYTAIRYNRIGNAGEYCVHLLNQRERQLIPITQLRHPKEEIVELREQTEAWLSEIAQGIQIRLFEYREMDLVNMMFSFIREGLPSRNFRAANVGFGLTYALPIFVAVLSATPGSLLLLENPEAHLHPRGQAVLGRFLGLAAANGIQVLIETHSDHILNGLRIAVKNGELTPEDTVIHFFDQDSGSGKPKIVTPRLDKDGRIDLWPDDFFDEWDKRLSELL